jgi:hypothetical protein
MPTGTETGVRGWMSPKTPRGRRSGEAAFIHALPVVGCWIKEMQDQGPSKWHNALLSRGGFHQRVGCAGAVAGSAS